MERQYRTSHEGIAAYLVMNGYHITKLESGMNRNNRPCTYFYFDGSFEDAKEMGNDFYDGNATGNLKDFREAEFEVRKQLRTFRGQ